MGAGTVAERRVRGLLDCGAHVTVVAPEATPQLRELAEGGAISLETREFRTDDVGGAALVFSATGDRAVDESVSQAARSAGIFVNVADEIGYSDFHLPAIERRGDIQIAVATGGVAPGVAAHLRDEIAGSLGSEWENLARLLGEVRTLARERITVSGARMAVMRRLAHDDALREEVARGEAPAAEAVLERALAQQLEAQEAGSAGATGPAAPSPRTQRRALVSIVGAGPGGAELITVAGLDRLQAADVVIYDDLVGEELLGKVRPGAQVIYGGKRGWTPATHRPGPDFTVEKALEGGGQRVVRLKGGDPSVFGRLAEELDALEAAGIEHEVIPGVTAALAAAAAARVSLTKRGCTNNVTLMTAVGEGALVCSPGGAAAQLLAEGGTLAIYMGLAAIGEFATRLVAAGVDSVTPVVVVAGVATAEESVMRSTLASVVVDVAAARIESPALVLIGKGLE